MSLEQNTLLHLTDSSGDCQAHYLREGLIVATSRKLQDHSASWWFHVHSSRDPLVTTGLTLQTPSLTSLQKNHKEPSREWATPSLNPCLEYIVSRALRKSLHTNVPSWTASLMQKLSVFTKNIQKFFSKQGFEKVKPLKTPLRMGKWTMHGTF